MNIKGQLKDAQIELVAGISERDALVHKVGRIVFVLSTLTPYISNGTSWGSLGSDGAVGDVKSSMLTEAQYQTHFGSEWVLADGRDVTGSDYHTITSNTNIPDLRGVFVRGKDNGRGLNPDGDLGLGSYTGDKIGVHSHSYNDTTWSGRTTGQIGSVVQAPLDVNNTSANQTLINNDASRTTVSSGSNETAPKSITINYFIKIYRDLA